MNTLEEEITDVINGNWDKVKFFGLSIEGDSDNYAITEYIVKHEDRRNPWNSFDNVYDFYYAYEHPSVIIKDVRIVRRIKDLTDIDRWGAYYPPNYYQYNIDRLTSKDVLPKGLNLYFKSYKEVEESLKQFEAIYRKFESKYNKIIGNNIEGRAAFHRPLMYIYCTNQYTGRLDLSHNPYLIDDYFWRLFQFGHIIINGIKCSSPVSLYTRILNRPNYEIKNIQFEFDYHKVKTYKKECIKKIIDLKENVTKWLNIKKN